jgi:DNA-binding XRE family transcriptional regulator
MSLHKHEVIQNHVYTLRRNRGYGQKQLALLLDRSPQTISLYERGVVMPPLKTALLLEIVLGARVSDLYLDLYRQMEQVALRRASRLPPHLGRHIRGRVLGKD